MAYKAQYTDQIAVRIPPRLREALETEADRREVAVATVVREALEERYGDGL